MSQAVAQLEPRLLWKNFADLNSVPRPSKKEERVRQFIKDFGHRLGLPVIEDKVGNIIIAKPATSDMENRQTVVLQSHLDMVHQKNSDTTFDFETQGIQMRIEGDIVRANGTTLGADNGIGVAAIMALLESSDIAHPALEALFTIDEETGMTGALGLEGKMLHGSIMLNLDTEDDRELTIGCAGGVDVTATLWYERQPTPEGHETMELIVRGLSGGHSGMDIHLGLGNANKLMNRLLFKTRENFGVRIASIEGGSLRNAIPRESKVVLTLPADKVHDFLEHVNHTADLIRLEYKTTDPLMRIALTPAAAPATEVAESHFQDRLIAGIYACPNGIWRMSPDIPGLVQSSNNLARITLHEGRCEIMCLTRSSVDSEKDEVARSIQGAFEHLEGEINFTGAYPGWMPNPLSPIVASMASLYEKMFGEKAHVNACHAGLECGILGRNYPGMDMVSFGPNIRGAHSPDENVQISSVAKFWKFLLATLEGVPERV